MNEKLLNEKYAELIELCKNIAVNGTEVEKMVSLMNVRNFISDVYMQGFEDGIEQLNKE